MTASEVICQYGSRLEKGNSYETPKGVPPHLLMRNAGVGQIHACVAGFLCQFADPKRIDL